MRLRVVTKNLNSRGLVRKNNPQEAAARFEAYRQEPLAVGPVTTAESRLATGKCSGNTWGSLLQNHEN
jgi:hypothetical protein